MNEKCGAIWVDSDDDDSSEIVEEVYSRTLEKLFVIYRRKDQLFMPFSYVKSHSPQWSMPFWSNENTKILVSNIAEAKEYLSVYGAGT